MKSDNDMHGLAEHLDASQSLIAGLAMKANREIEACQELIELAAHIADEYAGFLPHVETLARLIMVTAYENIVPDPAELPEGTKAEYHAAQRNLHSALTAGRGNAALFQSIMKVLIKAKARAVYNADKAPPRYP